MCCGSSEDESEMDFCQATMRATASVAHDCGGTGLKKSRTEGGPAQVTQRSSEDRAELGWIGKPVMVLQALHKLQILLSTTRDHSSSPKGSLELRGAFKLLTKKKKYPPWPSRGWVPRSRCHGRRRKLSTEKIFKESRSKAGRTADEEGRISLLLLICSLSFMSLSR